MDLNLVCGPAAVSRQEHESQMMDVVSAENTTAPLPSVHELENIRVSLDESDLVATEAASLHKPASSLSVSGSGSKLTAAPNTPITPPNSASHSNIGKTAGTPNMRHERSEYSDDNVSNDIAKTGSAANKLASLAADGKRRPSILEKYRAELHDVAEKCKILSQFSEQYGPEKNKFNAQPSDDLVIDMARKAYEVLMVFMTIRRERMSTSADDDTMEYIRKRRTVLSPTRSKSRKRSKKSDAAQPNTCRSCGISETPEWRRGPDGARTLCNACGLHYAKLNKKRATEANTHFSAEIPGSGATAVPGVVGTDSVSKGKAIAPNGDGSALQGSTIIANPHAGAPFPHHYHHHNQHYNHHMHSANQGQQQPTAQYVYPSAMQNQTNGQHSGHSAVVQQQHYNQQQHHHHQIHPSSIQQDFSHQSAAQAHYAGSLATSGSTQWSHSQQDYHNQQQQGRQQQEQQQTLQGGASNQSSNTPQGHHHYQHHMPQYSGAGGAYVNASTSFPHVQTQTNPQTLSAAAYHQGNSGSAAASSSSSLYMPTAGRQVLQDQQQQQTPVKASISRILG